MQAKRKANFELPELVHNLNLLVDLCEQDIIQVPYFRFVLYDTSVADLDPGTGAFSIPGFGIRDGFCPDQTQISIHFQSFYLSRVIRDKVPNVLKCIEYTLAN